MAGIRCNYPTGPGWEYSLDTQTWQTTPVFAQVAEGEPFLVGNTYVVYCRNAAADLLIFDHITFGDENNEPTSGNSLPLQAISDELFRVFDFAGSAPLVPGTTAGKTVQQVIDALLAAFDFVPTTTVTGGDAAGRSLGDWMSIFKTFLDTQAPETYAIQFDEIIKTGISTVSAGLLSTALKDNGYAGLDWVTQIKNETSLSIVTGGYGSRSFTRSSTIRGLAVILDGTIKQIGEMPATDLLTILREAILALLAQNGITPNSDELDTILGRGNTSSKDIRLLGGAHYNIIGDINGGLRFINNFGVLRSLFGYAPGQNDPGIYNLPADLLMSVGGSGLNLTQAGQTVPVLDTNVGYLRPAFEQTSESDEFVLVPSKQYVDGVLMEVVKKTSLQDLAKKMAKYLDAATPPPAEKVLADYRLTGPAQLAEGTSGTVLAPSSYSDGSTGSLADGMTYTLVNPVPGDTLVGNVVTPTTNGVAGDNRSLTVRGSYVKPGTNTPPIIRELTIQVVDATVIIAPEWHATIDPPKPAWFNAVGWAFDAKHPGTPGQIDLDFNGERQATLTTNIPRADVKNVYGLPGDFINYGFDLAIPQKFRDSGDTLVITGYEPGTNISTGPSQVLYALRFLTANGPTSNLKPGQSWQFSATGQYSDGNSKVIASPTYELLDLAAGDTISATGLLNTVSGADRSLKVKVSTPDRGLIISVIYTVVVANPVATPTAGVVADGDEILVGVDPYGDGSATPPTPSGNHPPTVSRWDDQVITATGSWSKVIPASLFYDPDNDAVNVSLFKTDDTALPAGISFDTPTRTLTVAAAYANGQIALRIRATDPGGLTAYSDFLMTVNRVTTTKVTAVDYDFRKSANGFNSDYNLWLKIDNPASIEVAVEQIAPAGSTLPKSSYTTMNTADYGNGYTKSINTYGVFPSAQQKIYVRRIGTTTDLLVVTLPAFPNASVPRTTVYTS